MPRKSPTEADRLEAIRCLIAGLAEGTDVNDLVFSIAPLHPPDNTFPGEAFMEIALNAMNLAEVQERDLPYDQLLSQHLVECEFRGRRAQKVKFAILATGAARGGIEPDLLEEIIWWRTDDFWSYALAAAVAIIRACAAKQNRAVGEFAEELGRCVGVDVHGGFR